MLSSATKNAVSDLDFVTSFEQTSETAASRRFQAQYALASMHRKQLTGLEYTTRREELERPADVMLVLWHI